MITIDIEMPGKCSECPLSYWIQTGKHRGRLMCKAIEAKKSMEGEADIVEGCLVAEGLGHRPDNCPIVSIEEEGQNLENMISIAEYAKRIGKATISVADKCRRGSLPGAQKVGRDWFVPADAEYPDLRVKTGEYIGARDKYKKTEGKSND